jgi:hypothetical protein
MTIPLTLLTQSQNERKRSNRTIEQNELVRYHNNSISLTIEYFYRYKYNLRISLQNSFYPEKRFIISNGNSWLVNFQISRDLLRVFLTVMIPIPLAWEENVLNRLLL